MSIKSYDNIIKYGNLANMVYESKNKFKQYLSVEYPEIKLKQWISCQMTDTQCAILADNDFTYVVFRGVAKEKGIKEFLNDSELTTHISMDKRYTEMDDLFYAHNGFLSAYDSVQDIINTTVCALDKYVIAIGHSLGGALSEICALDIATTFNNLLVRSYTFGTPRVGNKQFVTILNKYVRSLRVYHKLDPIPSVLPSFLGYCHSNHSLKLGSRFWFNFKRIKYHFMDTYISKLIKIRNEL